MKTTLRIPCAEQYAFLELTSDFMTPEDAVAKYREVTAMIQGGVGLPAKDWNRVLDDYLWGKETMEADEYGTMNATQQQVIQEIKRSRKRHMAKTA